ncbi:MAG TPA: DUF6394 family protein [Pseudomonadales bacterium]|jgi:hypothetical protein|nr:hypothetical protein [Gammaproteobacteria bacterium]MDP6024439.1 DUF6394 family protein [Pseudomonadales bacterium]MDP7452290.1 DUF6394 family protein [Arenicellales bacterium]MDP7315667.1 DUF6394 family protein [Pseudomonadales bacterium]MDP7576350.1 DUF6394 family protein [Pseudomonadales bacterium]|tara:strand:- start:3054 stop:3437 length:384 start_codon:yes stop_codon:yes gene_type:complete
MNPEKVLYAFTIVLAMTLNFGFFFGEINEPSHHHVYELYAAIFVNIVATILKFGDRTQIGAVLLASSLVSIIQLVGAAVVWGIAMYVSDTGMTDSIMASIVSLSGGALLANLVSVVLLVIETVTLKR